MKNIGVTLVLLRVQTGALVLQWFCSGPTKKLWSLVALLRVARKARVLQVICLGSKEKAMVSQWFCIESKEKAMVLQCFCLGTNEKNTGFTMVSRVPSFSLWFPVFGFPGFPRVLLFF